MKNFYSIGLLCFYLMIPELLRAQNLPEKFEGNWEGKGMLMETEANFEMNWNKVLNGQFLKLTFSSKRTSNEEEILFEASAMYKPEGVKWNGTWFDSRGISFDIIGTVEDNTLSVEWGSPDIEKGRTVYALIEGNEMTVTDYVSQNGTFLKFGEAVYHKSESQ